MVLDVVETFDDSGLFARSVVVSTLHIGDRRTDGQHYHATKVHAYSSLYTTMQSCIEVQTRRPKLVPSYISASDERSFRVLAIPASGFTFLGAETPRRLPAHAAIRFRLRSGTLSTDGEIANHRSSLLQTRQFPPRYIVFAFCVQRVISVVCYCRYQL